jgi:hypothetical protein
VCGMPFSGERKNGACFAGCGAANISGATTEIFGSCAHVCQSEDHSPSVQSWPCMRYSGNMLVMHFCISFEY